MGLSALYRDRLGVCRRSRASDGQGGYSDSWGSASYTRGRYVPGDTPPESLADQISGRAYASVILDPRTTTVAPGDRLVTPDGRTWDILTVNPCVTPELSTTSDGALLSCAEVSV